MKRKIISTADGTSSIYVPSLDEHYHSIHGAETESLHVFIGGAFEASDLPGVRILELGMGTGLNVILTFAAAAVSGRSVYYHALEKYPLDRGEVKQLRFDITMDKELSLVFDRLHGSAWDSQVQLSESFILFKERVDFRDFVPEGKYDIIYFDAFAPDVQPDLWTDEMFQSLFAATAPGGVLATYSSRGQVRRSLQAAGYMVRKLPGPPGKREFVRAIKPGA